MQGSIEKVEALLTKNDEDNDEPPGNYKNLVTDLVALFASVKTPLLTENIANSDSIELCIRVVHPHAVAVWFEPAGSAALVAPSEDELSSASWSTLTDEQAVPLMLKAAVARLHREHARLKREERAQQEEVRVLRQFAALEKAKREIAEKEKADKYVVAITCYSQKYPLFFLLY